MIAWTPSERKQRYSSRSAHQVLLSSVGPNRWDFRALSALGRSRTDRFVDTEVHWPLRYSRRCSDAFHLQLHPPSCFLSTRHIASYLSSNCREAAPGRIAASTLISVHQMKSTTYSIRCRIPVELNYAQSCGLFFTPLK